MLLAVPTGRMASGVGCPVNATTAVVTVVSPPALPRYRSTAAAVGPHRCGCRPPARVRARARVRPTGARARNPRPAPRLWEKRQAHVSASSTGHGDSFAKVGMRILVSNDDGIYSPGLQRLRRSPREFGSVGLSSRRMASGLRRATLSRLLRPVSHRRTQIGGFEAFRVNGTPARLCGARGALCGKRSTLSCRA